MRASIIRLSLEFILFAFLMEKSGLAYHPQEFPNYFREKVVDKQVQSVSEEAFDTSHLEHLVEQALFSIIRRLQIPHVAEDENGLPIKSPNGTLQIVTDGFFEKIEAKVKKKDPEAKVYAAGGVVRSLLGYIYKKIYNAHHKNPPESTEQVLDRIIRGEKAKGGTKSEILSLSALGVGSDLDILVETSEAGKAKSEEIKHEVTYFINSAESAAGLRDVHTKLKYAVVPIGDVKDYHDQMSRATAQGGSALDWLAFPLTQGSGEHMKMPPDHPDIFRKFLLGEYDYLPATDPKTLQDPEKQTIRGLRSLLEIPYLRLSKGGERQMKGELDTLITKVESGKVLSPAAYEQLEKMVRNARFEGAHNRFYSFEDTPAHSRGQKIEALVHQLSQASERDGKKLPVIPEFLMNRDLRKRNFEDKCGLGAKGLLVDHQEFIEGYTDHGFLYHGTPQVENILSVIRNGFVVSSQKQGSAAYGRGAYTTKDRATAEGYGALLQFKLKDGVQPRVMDWRKVEKNQVILDVVRVAKEKKIDPFQYLAEHCDIDFILNEHVLIQNTGAIEVPKKMPDIIHLYATKISLNPHDPNLNTDSVKEIFQDIKNYRSFHSLGLLVGMKDLPAVPNVEETASALMSHPNPSIRGYAASSYVQSKPRFPPLTFKEIPELKNALIAGLSSKENDLKIKSCDALKRFDSAEVDADNDLMSRIVALLTEPQSDIQGAGFALIHTIQPTNPETHLQLEGLLESHSATIRNTALNLISNLRKFQGSAQLLRILQNPDENIRRNAVHLLSSKSDNITRKSETQGQLVHLLESHDEGVRSSAAQVLSHLTLYSKNFLQLVQLLGSSDSGTRRTAAVLLERIDFYQPVDPQVNDRLLDFLGSSNEDVRRAAAGVFSSIRPTDPKILRALAYALQNPDEIVRDSIVSILRQRKPELKSMIDGCTNSHGSSVLSEAQLRPLLAALE